MKSFNFKFRLNQELINDVGYDIEYEAKEGEKETVQVWFQAPGEEEIYVLYEKEMVEQCVNDGSWVVL
ncbi:MAG: hypothetical protein E7231_00330 [Cellulosilyticum sp.]|nr:hypothetical protein [Cellulosilyticum sp.]